MSLLTDQVVAQIEYECRCGADEVNGVCLCVYCCICGNYQFQSDLGDDGLEICPECYGGDVPYDFG